MQTKKLLQYYPEVYQNFMIHKDRAISIPILQSRTNHLSTTKTGIHIREAKNNRIYIAYQKEWNKQQNMTFFNKRKNKREKTKIENKQFNLNKLSLLIEEEWDIIHYQKEILELAKNLEKKLSHNENIWNLWEFLRRSNKNNKNLLMNLWLEEQITCGLIHRNWYEYFTQDIWNKIKIHKEKQRIQLYNKQKIYKNKKDEQQYFLEIKKIFNKETQKLLPIQRPDFYEKTNNIQDRKKERLNYISHQILIRIIYNVDPREKNILNKDNRLKNIPNYCRIFKHNQNKISILLPKDMSSIVKEDLLVQIKKDNPSRKTWENIEKIFQTQGGIRRELNKENGTIRSVLRWKTFLLKDRNWTILAWDKENLIKKDSYDIIIDKTKNKLYIAWKKTTSKEIHSQSMTNEIIFKLIQNNFAEINNKALSRSSYSKNKNNMLGKIILPLRKIIKKNCNKDIKISCTWELNNFIIKKEPDDINIWRITTIFEEMATQIY